MVETSRWLEDLSTAEHAIQLRDVRERYGDEPACCASCACGWRGPRHEGRLARDAAWRAGMKHLEHMLP
jgi:hypothetical protein